jgi:hypothetical protein
MTVQVSPPGEYCFVESYSLLLAGDGKIRFANPQLESKPANWKLYFRAGKEVIEAVRFSATEWLRQLEGK